MQPESCVCFGGHLNGRSCRSIEELQMGRQGLTARITECT